MLGDLVREKFGSDAGEALSSSLGRLSGTRRMAMAARAVVESDTPEELFARMRKLDSFEE